MGLEFVMAAVLLIAASAGSYKKGKRDETRGSISSALETIQILESQIAALVSQNEQKDQRIATLEGRVNVLNDLVTQRAEVEAVHSEVLQVREFVERIAAKVGA